MKIAICDDDELFIDSICALVEQWAAKNNAVLTLFRFTNGDDLINAHRKEHMDLIILDIIMPLLNGMDTARELREADQMVPIIFLTTSREFAVDSYEVKAFNYLIKPVNSNKLFSVLDDFLKTLNLPENTFTVQTGDSFLRITISDVEYLEAQNKQVFFHMTDGRTITVHERFSRCAEVFCLENGFCRCHRSYIVNLSRVKEFSKSEIITFNQTSIPISRNSYTAFKETYFQHMFQQ